MILFNLVWLISYFFPFLYLQFTTVIEHTAGLQFSTAEDNLFRLDDADRVVDEEGNAIFTTKSNNNNITGVVHVNLDLTSPEHPSHKTNISPLLIRSRSAFWFPTPGRKRTER